jgi:hypothetical protein
MNNEDILMFHEVNGETSELTARFTPTEHMHSTPT